MSASTLPPKDTDVRVAGDFLRRYLGEAPVPLALERTFECLIMSQQQFRRPVLDIGCGEGLFARMTFGDRIDVGIDPQASELERARAYGGYDELIECAGDAVPKEPGSFRTVFSNSVIEHIRDIEPVLREIHRLLARDGVFYVTIPTDRFDRYTVGHQLLSAIGLRRLARRFSAGFNRFWQHHHCYTPTGWQELFAKCGFVVAASQQYCPKAVCLLNDAWAPLSLPSFVVKKLLNRWFLVPPLRRAIAPLLAVLLRRAVKLDPDLQTGGIMFFALRKAPAA